MKIKEEIAMEETQREVRRLEQLLVSAKESAEDAWYAYVNVGCHPPGESPWPKTEIEGLTYSRRPIN